MSDLAKVDAQSYDTHYEAVLDDEPEPQRKPVFVDAVVREDTRKPVIPAGLHRGNIGTTVRLHAGRNWHRARVHAVRSPWYLTQALFWAIVGVFRLLGRQIRWFWLLEQHGMRQKAATDGDLFGWSKLHGEAKATRAFRAWVLGAEFVAILVVVIVLYMAGIWWAWGAFALLTVPALARVGRPETMRIIQPAVVPPRFRVINSDIVLRAYYAAGLGHPDKPNQQVMFGSQMDRQGGGSRVLVDLPYGSTFTDAQKARPALASGLDVTENQVFISKDKTSTRRHELFVADVDPLSIPAGRTPMLACKPTDVWQPVAFGLDERGKKVTVPLMWNSILIGAQPRKGKTFSARLLALHAALDPYTCLLVADGKNSPDWKDFRLVAHRFVSGTHPNPLSAEPVEDLLEMLRETARHIREVNQILAGMPATVCPEGKLTRDLSRSDPRLRVWVLMMEEFQMYYETDEKENNKEIAKLLSFILAVGPSAGVTVLSSSQKPSGIGSGDVGTLFTRYRDNHAGRFALKCGSRQVSEAILGTEAYGEGFDAAALPNGPEYRGVGLLYGLTDETPTVRTYLATGEDSQKILLAARRLRENEGTLTGVAAGADMAREARDVLRDVDSVFHAGEAWISWPQLAERLKEKFPEHYAGTNQAAISAQVRALGAEGKKGRDQFQDGTPSVQGVPREHVAAALKRREIEGRR